MSLPMPEDRFVVGICRLKGCTSEGETLVLWLAQLGGVTACEHSGREASVKFPIFKIAGLS